VIKPKKKHSTPAKKKAPKPSVAKTKASSGAARAKPLEQPAAPAFVPMAVTVQRDEKGALMVDPELVKRFASSLGAAYATVADELKALGYDAVAHLLHELLRDGANRPVLFNDLHTYCARLLKTIGKQRANATSLPAMVRAYVIIISLLAVMRNPKEETIARTKPSDRPPAPATSAAQGKGALSPNVVSPESFTKRERETVAFWGAIVEAMGLAHAEVRIVSNVGFNAKLHHVPGLRDIIELNKECFAQGGVTSRVNGPASLQLLLRTMAGGDPVLLANYATALLKVALDDRLLFAEHKYTP